MAWVLSEPVPGVVAGRRSSSWWAVRSLTPEVQRRLLEAGAVIAIIGGFASIIAAATPTAMSNPAGMKAIGAATVTMGFVFAGLRLFGVSFVGRHLSVAFWLTFPVGTTFVTLSLAFAGPDYSFICAAYVIIPVFAFYLLSRAGSVVLLALLAIEYAAVLALVEGFVSPVGQWSGLMVTLAVFGVFTSGFIDRADRLAVSEQQARQELACVNDTLEEQVREQVADIERLTRLRRFLSPQIADVVLSAGSEAALTPHRREIAVFFCDLRGFTRFTQQAEPEEVLDVINAYYGVIGRLLHAYNGTCGDFAGDGIMAFFNDPVPCENPALAAVHMALAVREDMRTLVTDWQNRGYQLNYGVGIAYGYATLGLIGFEGREEYSPLGSIVNLGARLCSQAQPEQILIDPNVRAIVTPACETNTIGQLDLKGFHDPVNVSEVVGITRGPATMN